MSLMLPCLATANAISIYEIANVTNAYHKDGQQKVYLFVKLANYSTLLKSQLDTAGITTGKWFQISLIVTVVFRILQPLLSKKGFLNPACYSSPIMQQLVSRVTFLSDKMVEAIDFVSTKGTPFMGVVSLVVYVAIVFFGHPIVGIIGLIGVAITEIKHLGYLPEMVDEVLSPLSLVTQYITLFGPSNFSYSNLLVVFKILSFVFISNDLLDYLSKSEGTKKWLPSFLVDTPFKHIINTEKALSNFGSFEQVRSIIDRGNLTVNPSHIHASEVSEILPPLESLEGDELANTDAQKLFLEINELMLKNNSQQWSLLSTEANSGWQRLKNAVCEGRFPDITPINSNNLKLMIKFSLVHLFTTYQKEKNWERFEEGVLEIAKIGESCVEGWAREMIPIFNPLSKNYRWCVHQVLAHQRQAFMADTLRNLEFLIARNSYFDKKIAETFNSPEKLFGQAFRELFFQDPSFSLNNLPNNGNYFLLLDDDLNIGKIVLKRELIDKDKTTFATAGGVNNIHLLNQFGTTLWPVMRPFNAELYFKINGRGFYTDLLHYFIRLQDFSRAYKELDLLNQVSFLESKNLENSYGFFSNILIRIIIAINNAKAWLIFLFECLPKIIAINSQIVLPLPVSSHQLVGTIIDIYRDYQNTPLRLIERIYEAQKCNVIDGFESREIPWSVMTTFLSDLAELEFPVLDDTENGVGGYNPLLVEQASGPHGAVIDRVYQLTRKGVALLLWHLGVFEYSSEQTIKNQTQAARMSSSAFSSCYDKYSFIRTPMRPTPLERFDQQAFKTWA